MQFFLRKSPIIKTMVNVFSIRAIVTPEMCIKPISLSIVLRTNAFQQCDGLKNPSKWNWFQRASSVVGLPFFMLLAFLWTLSLPYHQGSRIVMHFQRKTFRFDENHPLKWFRYTPSISNKFLNTHWDWTEMHRTGQICNLSWKGFENGIGDKSLYADGSLLKQVGFS